MSNITSEHVHMAQTFVECGIEKTDPEVRCGLDSAMVESTDDPAEVTCPECLEALGAMSEITSEMLAKWKAYAEQEKAEGYFEGGCDSVLALTAEVERLRAELGMHIGIAASAIYHGAKSSAERQWRPMETAPRDDNAEVLVAFKATGYVTMAVWRRHEESWLYFNDYKDEGELRSCDDADLGGWLPLPKPPEKKS